jgi:CelD/BcsL family acetyltransferase involved in cellulose biosynthesis
VDEVLTMFHTSVINDVKQLKTLRAEWNQLLGQSHTNTIFLTWEWIDAWWGVFGDGAELFAVVVRSENGELVGVAPLLIRKSRYYKLPVREITFIGIGHADRLDFIISKKDPRIIDQIVDTIMDNKERWDIARLEQVPMESPLARNEFRGDAYVETEPSSFCPFLEIEGDWETYFKSLKRGFRNEIRNRTKRLNRLRNWEFQVRGEIGDVRQLLDSLENVEQRSRKAGTERAFFSNGENKTFLLRFCKSCLEKDRLIVSSLTVNDTLIAYSLGFLYDSTFHGYSTAYDEKFSELSPGILVINEKIKWFFENPDLVKVYDFLRGDTLVKAKWTSKRREQVRMVFFHRSLFGNMLRYAVFHLRPRIKRILKRWS